MAFSILALLSGRRRHATVPLALRAYHRPSVTMMFTVKTVRLCLHHNRLGSRHHGCARTPSLWPSRYLPRALVADLTVAVATSFGFAGQSTRVRQVCALVISIALPSRTTGIPCVAASFRSVSPSPSPSGAQTLVTVSSGRAPEAMVCETPAAYEIPTTSGTPNSGRDTAPY
jgi:hypothetical protein